ncbi:MAG: IS66 family transposase [Parabacteroides sp.]|nr:IS66 family transposase [Parabacteroides sp.]
MSKFIQFLFTQLEEIKEELQRANATIAENASEQKRLNALVLSLTNQLNDALRLNREQALKIANLEASSRISKKHRFGSSSQKGIVKKEEVSGRDDDKDDFDGTAVIINTSMESESIDASSSMKREQNRISSKGCSNSKMSADYQVLHRCDMNQIPSDAIILKKSIRKVFDSINLIVEHDFEEVTYKTSDGRIITNYFPMKDDKDSSVYNERFHGTHATGNLLSTLAFNRYQLSTPAYREMARMAEMKMSVSRQTLINWYGKMADKLNKLIPSMKEEALHEGANVNVDETWCRYQSRFGHKKHYMWCLANKAAKTVIFFYDEGKRNRNVLREFLVDAKIHSLQSDGYNVYMYLDDGLHDIEHLCCMAHVRAKFKYAYEQGMDSRAKYFLDKIGWLYNQEKKYRKQGLTAGEIKDERNSDNVNQVITDLRNKLDYHLYFDKVAKGDLMQKAINYMHTFWEQLFRYRNDGNYTIDNSLAERCIRPMTLERKNSLFFCSEAGAKASAIFHTIIETCKQLGLSAREYIKNFLKEVSLGRTDWQNLTPAKIYILN